MTNAVELYKIMDTNKYNLGTKNKLFAEKSNLQTSKKQITQAGLSSIIARVSDP